MISSLDTFGGAAGTSLAVLLAIVTQHYCVLAWWWWLWWGVHMVRRAHDAKVTSAVRALAAGSLGPPAASKP